MSLLQSYQSFKTDLHVQWAADRDRRLKVPVTEAWRGSLGLAILYRDDQDAIDHGPLSLMPAANMTFVCLRDVPIGHFPGSRSMNKRDVNYVTRGLSRLHHGMPLIDCVSDAREAWDFKFLPFPEYVNQYGPKAWDTERVVARGDVLHSEHNAREFGVLNRLSEAMTNFAFAGIDHGQPVRPAWGRFKPKDMKAIRAERPESFFPVPYTAFDIDDGPQLYWAVSESEAGGSVHDCPACHRAIESSQFNSPKARTEFFEDGNFVASCPSCGKRRKWFLDDARPTRVKRRFGLPFRQRFCRAVADGLPLVATIGNLTYAGRVRSDLAADGPEVVHDANALRLFGHKFVTDDGRSTRVFVPEDAVLLVEEGQVLAAGEQWAQVLPRKPNNRWNRLHDREQWATLHEVCGGPEYVGMLQRLWFNNQAVHHEDLVLFPSDLVVTAARQFETKGLWWDLMPCSAYMNPRVADAGDDSIVLPPIRLRHWDRLTLPMPHETILDARITDPRFSEGRRWSPEERERRRQQPRPDNRNLRPKRPQGSAEESTISAIVDAFLNGDDLPKPVPTSIRQKADVIEPQTAA